MKNRLAPIVLIALFCSFDTAAPCLEDGASRTITRSLDMEAAGMPAGARIDRAEAVEVDWGGTEPMGTAEVLDPKTVSVEVTNKGGYVTGPNGKNVGGGGDTIEVNFCITLRYLVTVSKKTKGLDGSETVVEYQQWQEHKTSFRSDTDVTPC